MAFKRERDDWSHSIKAKPNKTAQVPVFTCRVATGQKFDNTAWPGRGETAPPGVVWDMCPVTRS